MRRRWITISVGVPVDSDAELSLASVVEEDADLAAPPRFVKALESADRTTVMEMKTAANAVKADCQKFTRCHL